MLARFKFLRNTGLPPASDEGSEAAPDPKADPTQEGTAIGAVQRRPQLLDGVLTAETCLTCEALGCGEWLVKCGVRACP